MCNSGTSAAFDKSHTAVVDKRRRGFDATSSARMRSPAPTPKESKQTSLRVS